MRTIKNACRFLNRAEESECARDETDIVVDCLRNSDYGKRMTAATRSLIEIICAALRAVAANGEENVHIARDQIINRAVDIDRPT